MPDLALELSVAEVIARWKAQFCALWGAMAEISPVLSVAEVIAR